MNGWEILSKYNYCYPIQINYWNMKIVKKIDIRIVEWITNSATFKFIEDYKNF